MQNNSNSESSPVRKRISQKTLIKLLGVGLVVVAGICYLIWDIIADGPITSFLTNREEIIALIQAHKIFAPIIYIILQIIQTVVAPIPGQVVGGVGGFIFGWWGILWTTIGTVLGSAIVFWISKKFGRPLIEKIFKKSAVEKFDFIINSKSAALIIFIIFLLPGFPDDLVCYIAGLTALPIGQLLLLMTLGRLPVIIVTNLIGAGITTNIKLVLVLCILAAILLGVGIWQRDRIVKFLKNLSGHKEENA